MTDNELAAWLDAILAEQEPLGPEFTAIWEAGADELYES